MSNIASSTYMATAQKDGRQWVYEVHADLVGILHELFYLAGAGDDLAANLATHATTLGLNLQASEIATNVSAVESLGSLASPTFVYSTAAQNLAALRSAYAVATDRQVVMIGDFLSTLTVVQLETIFSLTALQVATLQANKLQPAATLAASIRSAVGQ